MREACIGVDVGGTWMRLAAVSLEGALLRRGRVRSAPPDKLPGALAALLRRWGLRPAALVLGSTGLGRAADRACAALALRRLSGRVRVVTDIELGWRAALGGPGVLLLAGTGSFAFGRDARGRAARVGGLGPYLGDEGSSFWIGREWLRGRPEAEALAYAHRARPQAAVASLASRVLRLAGGRGAEARRARRIVDQAQCDLAAQARACAARLAFGKYVPISWHGGLMEHEPFRRGVLRRLGRRFQPRPPRAAPERAAAALALDLLQYELKADG